MPHTLPEITPAELRPLRGGMIPRSVQIRSFLDSTGEDAIEAILVFSNALTDNDLRWNNVKGVVDAVRRLVLEKDGGDRYVHVLIRRQKELKSSKL